MVKQKITGLWVRMSWIMVAWLMGANMVAYAAADAELARFTQANVYFQQKKYDSALHLYQACIAAGILSPDVYYNAGCAAFESRQIGQAVYYFKKALLLAQEKGLPTKDIEHNLHVAEQQIKEMPETLPPLFFVSFWYRLAHLFSLNTWALLVGINIWILAFLLVVKWRKRSPAVKYFLIGSICTLIWFIALATSAYQSTHPRRAAVCVLPQVALYTAPDSQSTVMMQLYGGVSCKVIDTAGQWCKVQLPNHTSGWVRADAIQLL
ncbi:MAG: SH3 domain-containing protein [Thermoflavifilum sp.]|nr:SH3 domain-containing protein [Thermoflavifilum sp.]